MWLHLAALEPIQQEVEKGLILPKTGSIMKQSWLFWVLILNIQHRHMNRLRVEVTFVFSLSEHHLIGGFLSEPKRIISFQRCGKILEQPRQDVLCLTYSGEKGPSLSFYHIPPQPCCPPLPPVRSSRTSTSSHQSKSHRIDECDWFEQMTWCRSVVNCSVWWM